MQMSTGRRRIRESTSTIAIAMLQFMRMLIKLTPSGYIDIAGTEAAAAAAADAMSQSATASDNF